MIMPTHDFMHYPMHLNYGTLQCGKGMKCNNMKEQNEAKGIQTSL